MRDQEMMKFGVVTETISLMATKAMIFFTEMTVMIS